MEFLEWWFTEHYIWSTLLTSKFTFIWAIYKGLVIRGAVAFILMLLGSIKFGGDNES
jgi:hypothetical protein